MSKGIGFILFMALLLPSEVFAQFAGGSGTPGDPYQVATAAQLNEVRNHLSSHFIQTADIDLGGDDPAGDFYYSGLGWVPIGQFNSEFEGSYNGDGYKITGLYMQRVAAGVRAGLFGYIDTDASLVNVHLEDVDVTGNSPVGGLLGENSNGSVSNCSVTGTVAGVSNVGGLVGLNGSGDGSVSLSYANVAVSGTNSGVLVGNNSSGNVNSSFTEGSSPNASGGLVGRNSFGVVINSYSTVDGANGGVVGYNTGTISTTYAAGTSDTGGLLAEDGGGSEVANYWNTASGSPDNGFGTGLTEAEMKQQASFSTWNFSTIWAIDEGNSYPYLKNNPPVIPLSAPVLVSPADETAGVEDAVTLVWNTVQNADSYTLEKAASDEFIDSGEPYALEEGITDTTFFISDLPPNQTLYWRVKAVNGDQESEWSPAFSFTSSETSSMPGPITLNSPFDGATGVLANVTLSWQSDEYADEYQIQLDTLEGFVSPISDMTKAGTNTTTGVLDDGTKYYWRVRGVNEYGEGSWSDVFSFTTEEAQPSAPELLFPVNSATGLEDTVTAVWSSVENADSYIFEGSETSDFSDPNNFYMEGITDTTLFIPELPPDRELFWRVKTLSGEQESEWSEVFSFFTTENSLMPDPITLIFPLDMSPDQPLEMTFVWRSDVFADEYQIQIDESDAFTSPVADNTVQDTLFASGTLEESTTYFWRVRGINEYGAASWSQVFSFTTLQTLPDAPQLLSPAKGTTGVEDTLTIKWRSVEGADSYTLEVSGVDDFNSEDNFLAEGIEDTTYFGDGLPPSVTFYWRVKTVVGEDESEWSEVFNFTTTENSAKPKSIALIAPADEVQDLPLEISFLWHSDSYAEEYQIKVAEDAAFSSIIFNNSDVDTSITITEGLAEGSTYYWRVRGTNVYHEGDWSDTYSFTTAAEPLDPPGLLYPADGSTGLKDTVTAVWSAVENAVSYNFEGSEVENFDNADNYFIEGITDTTLFIPELPPARQLYWRVKAVAEDMESEWSEVFSFATSPLSSFPDSIKLISPVHMAENQPTELTFTWHSDVHADEYQFQLDDEESFNSPAIDSVSADTALTSKPLAKGTSWFWRVRGLNEYGEAAWSKVYSFSVEDEQPSPVPALLLPANEATGLEDSVIFVWKPLPEALNYEFQGSYVADFSEGIFWADTIVDTTLTVHIFPPSTVFYWRVRGIFEEGLGEWSSTWSFTTGPTSSFPKIPILHLPGNEAMDTDLILNLKWFPDDQQKKYGLAVNYDVEVSTDAGFAELHTHFEEVEDTTVTIQDLAENTQYYWRVRGNNEYGTGEWSESWSFTTKLLTSSEVESGIPDEFALRQNYPNPFNPSTIIRYDLPKSVSIDLRVFDMLGREVATLVDENNKPAGSYSVNFNAANLSSGMYIYRLKAGSIVLTKKLTLIK
ncbi:T9SS type A sorting domain-containing protein [Gracilimonas sediminicola]|uniref:T9SS type A sorting domain-containing protein n=1 Tax=Gracilimonas sediminicola TaxID=2952158 RepID=A0A9X2RGC2_9BACT|nr:T9SS type A sorting domain-containing protein [Gracilimonas sediminicola]MCP9291418.1 T9SS type A sorting domain-containing protein [Gracilimonas sediminicola]